MKETILLVLKRIRSPEVKFAFKVGLAAGAVYYVSEQGVWKDSVETTKLYGRISEQISPYLEQAKSQIPVEVPHLPSSNQISYLVKQYWNKGVMATFTFLGDLPENCGTWTKKGVDAAMSNEGIKNFIEPFSGTPKPTESVEK